MNLPTETKDLDIETLTKFLTLSVEIQERLLQDCDADAGSALLVLQLTVYGIRHKVEMSDEDAKILEETANQIVTALKR